MKYAALALIACLSLFNQSVHAAAAPQAEPEFILPAGVSPDDPEAAELAMQYFTLGPSFVSGGTVLRPAGRNPAVDSGQGGTAPAGTGRDQACAADA